MRAGNFKILVFLALLGVIVGAGWQIGAAEIANLELREDLRDVSAEMGAKIGLSVPSSDQELRRFVIEKGESHDIHLQPSEVTVRVTGAGKDVEIYLAADYSVRVNLLAFSFPMHFKPTSER